MTLAACLIVKNESLVIRRCLFWNYRGLALLGAGDTEGYRDVCAGILRRFGQSVRPRTPVGRTVWPGFACWPRTPRTIRAGRWP